jgi:hypothetical protein
MLGLGLACVVLALALPRLTSESPEEAEVKELPAPPEMAVAPTPQAGADGSLLLPVAETGDGGGTAAAGPSLPPVSEVTISSVNTPQEIKERLTTLLPYYRHAMSEERQAAYKALLDLGPNLVSRLPELIEKAEGAELGHYANAARELKAVNAAAAIIARLEAKDKPPASRFELSRALASLDDPAAREYLLAAMKGTKRLSGRELWEPLGPNMDAAQVDCALQLTAAGKGDAMLAAQALGRYAQGSEKSAEVAARVEPLLGTKTGAAKAALVTALAGMDPAVTANTLAFQARDDDPEVRAAALSGLARNPAYVSSVQSALQGEENVKVRVCCAGALADNPSPEVLPLLIELLNDPATRGSAHRGLVRANAGTDLGIRDFVWRAWLQERQGKTSVEVPEMDDELEVMQGIIEEPVPPPE